MQIYPKPDLEPQLSRWIIQGSANFWLLVSVSRISRLTELGLRALIAVQKGMNGFKLRMNQCHPHHGRQLRPIVMNETLHIGQQSRHVRRRWRHESSVARPRATNPMIGVHVEGRSIKSRARMSAETSERFQLVCRIPKPGCYAMPVTIGASSDLAQTETAESALLIFKQLMGRISDRTDTGLAAVLPDERIRRRVLELVNCMAPRAGAKWTLGLHDASNAPFATFNQDTIPFVQQTLVPEEQREASRVVTGELGNINFFERKLTIVYPPTSNDGAAGGAYRTGVALYARRCGNLA